MHYINKNEDVFVSLDEELVPKGYYNIPSFSSGLDYVIINFNDLFTLAECRTKCWDMKGEFSTAAAQIQAWIKVNKKNTPMSKRRVIYPNAGYKWPNTTRPDVVALKKRWEARVKDTREEGNPEEPIEDWFWSGQVLLEAEKYQWYDMLSMATLYGGNYRTFHIKKPFKIPASFLRDITKKWDNDKINKFIQKLIKDGYIDCPHFTKD